MKKYSSNIENIFLFTALLSLFLIIVVKYTLIIGENYFVYTTWADRALSRGIFLLQNFQVNGAEYSARQGARTPGGGLYYFLYLLININESPLFIYFVSITLHFLSACLIFLIGRKISSSVTGAIAATVYIISLGVNDVAWQMWNPLFGLPFGVLGYFFFYRVLSGAPPINFAYAIGFLFIATQMHIAYFTLIFAFLVIGIVFAKSIQLRHYAMALGVGLILYSPWLISQLPGAISVETLPMQFFPGFSGAETSTGPVISAYIPKYELGLSVWIERLSRIVIEALSFAETNHVVIDLPLVSLALAALFFILIQPSKQAGQVDKESLGNLRRHALILLIIVVTCNLIIFLAGTVTHGLGAKLEINRYIVHATPAMALLSGLTIDGLFRHADKAQFPNLVRLFAIAVFSAIPIKALLIGFDDLKILNTEGQYRPKWMLFTDGSGLLYKDRLELFQHIKRTYGQNFDIKNRVASVVWNRDWTFLATPSEYFPGIRQSSSKTSGFYGCLLVFWRKSPFNDAYVSEENLDAALSLMQGKGLGASVPLKQATILNKKITKKYLLVHYDIPTGGCAKTFDNPYILSEKERLVENKLQERNIKFDAVAVSKVKTRFYIKHDVAGTKYPLNILLELDNERSGILALTLVSKQLNSASAVLDGYWEPFFIESPGLILRNKQTGDTIRYGLLDGVLGSAGFTTPWRPHNLKVLPGVYEVRLTANAVGRLWGLSARGGQWGTGSMKKMDVLLSSSFYVQ